MKGEACACGRSARVFAQGTYCPACLDEKEVHLEALVAPTDGLAVMGEGVTLELNGFTFEQAEAVVKLANTLRS